MPGRPQLIWSSRGVPSRLAHEQIGKAVKLCLEKNCELQDLSLDELHESAIPHSTRAFYDCLKPAAVLAIHDVVEALRPPSAAGDCGGEKENRVPARGGLSCARVKPFCRMPSTSTI
jgi:hypothetical protein